MERMAANEDKLYQAVQDYPKQQANLISCLGASFQQYVKQHTQFLRMQPSQDSFPESVTRLSGAKIEAPISLAVKTPELVPIIATPDAFCLELDSQNSSHGPRSYHLEEILNDLRTFLDQLENDMQEIVQMTFCASHTVVDSRVRNDLLSWTRDTKPNRLWIQGPSGIFQRSQNRITAVCLTALSHQSHIPCISYFCSPNYGQVMSTAVHDDALSEMLASLIIQLALLLPKHFTTSLDLSSSRFAILKSDCPTLTPRLELFHDLRSLAPKYLHCILDGVQILENRSEPQHTQNLSNLILRLCTLDEEKARAMAEEAATSGTLTGSKGLNSDREEGSTVQVTKICFTTDGYMDGLAKADALHLVNKVEYTFEASELFAEDTTQFLTL